MCVSVQAATPQGLLHSAKLRVARRPLSLDVHEIHQRFFSAGPTHLFALLDSADSRIQSINARLDQFECWNSTTPTSYSIKSWGGTNETMWTQCTEQWSGSGFDQFALHNGVFYMFERSAETMMQARVWLNGSSAFRVELWFSVGLTNLNGSHGVVRVLATLYPAVLFEMSVAGSGFGYCGAQLRSDNVTMNITGSSDQGTTCGLVDSVCVDAGTMLPLENCTTALFQLPALGRMSYHTFGASRYPGHNTVYLSADGHDDTVFAPF